MLAILTETKKIILKGVAIATAVICVATVAFKIDKKVRQRGLSHNNTPTSTSIDAKKTNEGNVKDTKEKSESNNAGSFSLQTPEKSIVINKDDSSIKGKLINIDDVPDISIRQRTDNSYSTFNNINVSDTGSNTPSSSELSLDNESGSIERENSDIENKSIVTKSGSAKLAPNYEVESVSEMLSLTNSSESSSSSELFHDDTRVEKGTVKKGAWVALFTKNEKELRTNAKKVKELFLKRGDATYVKTVDGEEIKAGTFHKYSVGELKEALADKEKVGGGKISAIGIKAGADNKYADVSCLQADPKYANNTVFVLASNFNALETLGNVDNIDYKYLSSYASDPTQGPTASISAPATALFRQYAIFRHKGNEEYPLRWKQRNDGFDDQKLKPRQLNLLEDLGINTQNGYVIDKPHDVYNKVFGKFKDKHSNAEYLRLPDGIDLEQLPSNAGEAYDKFKIAYFSDCQVVYKSNGDGKLDKFYDKNQLVDQVCVAALALDYNDGWPNHNPKLGNFTRASKYDAKSAQLVLKAQFEAIFRAAALHGKKNVVIPIVGGGVFHNSQDWTIQALEELKDIIEDYGLNVIVNTYRSDNMNGYAKAHLIDLIKETGGTFDEYRKGSEVPVNLAEHLHHHK